MSDISIYVTSKHTSSERRVSPQWSISHFKTRVEPITGIPPAFQKLVYYPTTNTNTTTDLEGDFDLSRFKIIPYSRIHVIDTRPESDLNELNELDKADNNERFVLTEEEYAKKNDSVLRWKESNKLGRFDPEFQARQEEDLIANESIVSRMKPGSRCRIINIDGERRGVIKFIGKVPEIDDNYWVGLEFDEPVGKNDGIIKGARYFTCLKNHGSFIKPSKVEVGDFPELELFSDLDDDEL